MPRLSSRIKVIKSNSGGITPVLLPGTRSCAPVKSSPRSARMIAPEELRNFLVQQDLMRLYLSSNYSLAFGLDTAELKKYLETLLELNRNLLEKELKNPPTGSGAGNYRNIPTRSDVGMIPLKKGKCSKFSDGIMVKTRGKRADMSEDMNYSLSMRIAGSGHALLPEGACVLQLSAEYSPDRTAAGKNHPLPFHQFECFRLISTDQQILISGAEEYMPLLEGLLGGLMASEGNMLFHIWG